jgi:magnesium transporter
MSQTNPIPPSIPPPSHHNHGADRDLHPIELFIPEIKALLQKKELGELKYLLAEINPIDLADGFGHFSSEEQLLLLRLLKSDRMIEVFEELDFNQQEYIVQNLDGQTLTPLLENIPADVTAQLFKNLPERIAKRMANMMKKEKIEIIQDMLEYGANTVGAMMNTDVIFTGPDITAKAALGIIQARTRVRKSGTALDTLYVCNGNRRLLGAVPLRTLLAAPADIKMKDIMSPVSLIRIYAKMDREEAAAIFSRYKMPSAPVVNEENRLVGVLAIEDVLEVIEEEDTEDIQKMAAVEALDEPYFEIGLGSMIKKRATWLCVLFFGEILTAFAMAFFEHQIARAVVLALFIPLIISSGGNSGSQAATLIIRAMALKEVRMRDWWRVMQREFASGAVLGLILGSIGFLQIYIWSQFADTYGPHYLGVAATVGSSLILVVLWGSFAGSLLPIVLRRAGLDPAVASAPLVATLVDVTGLIIYFTVGMLVLRGTLL